MMKLKIQSHDQYTCIIETKPTVFQWKMIENRNIRQNEFDDEFKELNLLVYKIREGWLGIFSRTTEKKKSTTQ